MTITPTKVPSIISISSDKDRINALYGPFRPKDANPEHYNRKLKFWMSAVDEYGTACGRVSFTISELKSEFRVDEKSPVCLREVIDELYR